MKVKDLIEELKSCDQDAVVSVEGTAISYIDQLPGYYDGTYHELVEDASGNTKLVIRDDDVKVIIKTLEPDWFLLDDPDATVEIICSGSRKKRWEKRIEEIRKENRKIVEQINNKKENTFVADADISKTSWLTKMLGLFRHGNK